MNERIQQGIEAGFEPLTMEEFDAILASGVSFNDLIQREDDRRTMAIIAHRNGLREKLRMALSDEYVFCGEKMDREQFICELKSVAELIGIEPLSRPAPKPNRHTFYKYNDRRKW